MNKKTQSAFRPNYAVAPGETLLETLTSLGMSQAELAGRTGTSKKTISAIIAGNASITAETALQLERALGILASFWSNLERNHQESPARLKEEKERADERRTDESFE